MTYEVDVAEQHQGRLEQVLGDLRVEVDRHWDLRETRRDDKVVTHQVLETTAAFLDTEGGDLLIGVADDKSILAIEVDRLEGDDKFVRHLAQVVRNGLGDRSSTCRTRFPGTASP